MCNMRESGVEWIGTMPIDWQLLTIGSLFKVRNEKVNDTDYPPLSVSKGGIVPQMENVAKTDANDNRKLVLENDFVINSRSDRKQSCGVSSMDGSVSLINTVLYLVPNAPVVPEYLNYLLKNHGFAEEFYKWGHGIVADLWTTRWQEMKNILLPIPTKEVQIQILNRIETETQNINTLIANVQTQIEKLKAYKQSLITEVVTRGLDPTVPMKESGISWLGTIPQNWDIVKIIRIADKTHPYAIGDGDHGLIKPDDYLEEGIPYIRVQNLGWATELDTTNIVYISEETNQKIKNSTLRPNDVIFAKTGATIGKTAIIPPNIPIANTTSHVGKITVSNQYNARYVFYVLSSVVGYRQFWEYASSKTTRPELAMDEIKQIYITLPRDLNEQTDIVNYLDKTCEMLNRLIAIKQRKIEELEQYKKTIIYEYITGKKEVL